MKINNPPPAQSGSNSASISSVNRITSTTTGQQDFQTHYLQQQQNLGQIILNKNHIQSATKQLQQLQQKDPSFPSLDQLVLLKDHKPQTAVILTARIVQYLKPKIWSILSSSEKLQITSEYLESMCHFLKMDPAELYRTNELKSHYLSESQLESYRNIILLDQKTTEKWLLGKDKMHPSLVIQPPNPQLNAVADSLGIASGWIWDDIGDTSKGYLEFFEFDQFYRKQGYELNNGTMNFHEASIVVFGTKINGIYQLKHAGHINRHGFYQSKQNIAGTVLWPSPEADASAEFGTPLLQYRKIESHI